MAAFDPVPVSSLTKQTTLSEVEARHPVLIDRSAYFGRQGWEAVASEWTEFKERVLPGDEIWEYDTLRVKMGFASGESGLAIVRNGRVVERYPMSAYG
jgi:hypothetical protein